jgi:hypothetical protein
MNKTKVKGYVCITRDLIAKFQFKHQECHYGHLPICEIRGEISISKV